VPPAELRQRIRDGKVYPSHKVEQALTSFFRTENLAALRQLVLREVANEVEERVRAQPRVIGRPGLEDALEAASPVADAERVMVCLSSQPSATRRLLRHGARLAGGLNSRWFVAYVRTAGEAPTRIETSALRSLSDNLTLARELGADVVRLEGEDVARALSAFAHERAITHAVFGRTRLPVWKERLKGSVLDRFMRLAPSVDVLVVGEGELGGERVGEGEEP
jgi:two-component system, OmpR family, sensor histidine kinase KdpD